MQDNNALAQELEAKWRGFLNTQGAYASTMVDRDTCRRILSALRQPAPASGEVGHKRDHGPSCCCAHCQLDAWKDEQSERQATVGQEVARIVSLSDERGDFVTGLDQVREVLEWALNHIGGHCRYDSAQQVVNCFEKAHEVLAAMSSGDVGQAALYKSFTDGMEAAAEICGTLAEHPYDDTDAFEAATGCEAAIMRVVKEQRAEQKRIAPPAQGEG